MREGHQFKKIQLGLPFGPCDHSDLVYPNSLLLIFFLLLISFNHIPNLFSAAFSFIASVGAELRVQQLRAGRLVASLSHGSRILPPELDWPPISPPFFREGSIPSANCHVTNGHLKNM